MKKSLALLLALLMMVGILAGCSGGEEETTSTEPQGGSDTTSTAPTYEGPIDVETTEIELPLVDDTYTFSYWIGNSYSFEDFNTYADNLFFQWMEEQTNVAIEWVHPPVGSEKENFQTIVLSNDYPDFVQGIKGYYDGGVDKAIKDNFLQPLNDYMDLMPNYKAMVYANETTFVQAVSDEGNIWGIHHIVDRPQGSWIGPGVRADWLEKAGLTTDDCATYESMEKVLTAFKDYTYEGEGPLWLGAGSMTVSNYTNAAFALGSNYSGSKVMNIDGVATYTGTQASLKDYAAQMADWYAKGLINKNYIGENSWGTPEAYIVNSQIGVYEFVYTNDKMFASSAATSQLQPEADFRLAAIPAIKKDASQTDADIHLRNSQDKIRSGNSMGITTQCSDLELACAYWNYAWSDEGKTASNWGPTVGEYGDQNATYYVDESDANGDGHIECYQPWLMEKYNNVTYVQVKVACHNLPTYSIWSREWCTLDPEQIEYCNIWDQVGNEYCWPEGVTLTSEEGNTASGIIAAADTAVNEWLAAVITGTKSADTYETELLPTLTDEIGIATAVEMYQNALTRYQERVQYLG